MAILDKCILAAVEQIESGVLAVDRKGEVLVFNQAAERITGYSRKEVLGHSYEGLPFAAHGDGREDPLSRMLSMSEVRGRKTEKLLGCKSGRRIPVESQLSSVLDGNGNMVGAVEIFTDLSAINKLKDEVSKSRTLSALGEMAANVAHEIRNPLGSIGGFASLLERDLEDDDPRRNLVKKIIEGVARLDRIATNLLIYTRPIKPDLRWTDLIGFVDEVLAFQEMKIENLEPPVSVMKSFPTRPIGVMIDPNLMQQVLTNIFDNAVYAMKEKGGCLDIRISRITGESSGKEGNFTENAAEEYVEFVIRDEGQGMSEEVQSKVFNPFFTTREDGTGLGLAICKRMIQVQDGSIAVSSRPGAGTNITLHLPCYPGKKG